MPSPPFPAISTADEVSPAAPADDPGYQMSSHRMVGVAEAQRVQHRNRPRTHRKDVAQDAADPGRRALVGLDERGMIVALDLEDDGVAVADVDDAGVLARTTDDARSSRR